MTDHQRPSGIYTTGNPPLTPKAQLLESYGAVKPAFAETLADTLQLLPMLEKMKEADKAEIKALAEKYAAQPDLHQDIFVAPDIFTALPNQLRSLAGLASFCETIKGAESGTLSRMEKDAASLPWATAAEFRTSIMILHAALKATNKSIDPNQPFDKGNLNQPGKYDELIAQTGLIMNKAWNIQVFAKQNEEKDF